MTGGQSIALTLTSGSLPRRTPLPRFDGEETGPLVYTPDPIFAESAVPAVEAELAVLRERVPGVRGCVVAGVDGLLVIHDLGNGPEPHDLAALAGAAFGVGRQCGLALRQGPFRESTFRSYKGYFTVYAVGETALLAVLGDDGINVARLHLEARPVADRLADLLHVGTT